ncbi:MAG TPA: TRL-like family protein [Candidatus Paceibacterota bacterium]|nr:TRL-like family protein [Verrucomicrobiota bacterium]HSA10414.1 TRL-like family protein [Candidatus Paceibacterota bacterium]
MKKLIGYSSMVAVAGLLVGCVGPMGPVGSVGGFIYTDVSGPILATSHSSASKVGQASSTGIICFATGDSSIKAAADSAGITKIQHVDYHTTSVLGVYAKTTVTVYGE